MAALEAVALGEKVDAGVADHVRNCERCAELIREIRENESFAESFLASATWSGSVVKGRMPRPDVAEDIVPGYTIIREIHRGGQGVVYLARQSGTQREVAIKMLLAGAFATQTQRMRFEHEAQLAARLRHPAIVTVHDIVPLEKGRYAIVMEHVAGVALDRWTPPGKTGEARRDTCLRLFAAICDAIQYAHHRQVAHRDLKPQNILVTEDGQPKVLDFGVAKAQGLDSDMPSPTVTGEFIGTLAYASPEQLARNPDRIDTRTDVYSLGVMLYEQLAGRRPTQSEGPMDEVLTRMTGGEPMAPSHAGGPYTISSDLDAVVLKALRFDPDERYQSAAGLARDLENILSGTELSIKRDNTVYVLMKRLRRHRRIAAVIGVFGMVLAVAAVTSTVLYFKASEAEGIANTRLIASERATYRASITAAYEALLALDSQGVRRYLEATPPALRGWEYDYIGHQIGFGEILFHGHGTGLRSNGAGLSASGLWAFTIGDGRARIMDVSTKEPVRQWSISGRIGALNADGSRLFSADGRAIHIWNCATGESIREGFGHPEDIDAMALSRDERFLATACLDGFVRVFDVASSAELHRWPAPRANSVAISGDSGVLGVTCSDGSVRAWNIDSGTLAFSGVGHDRPGDVALGFKGIIARSVALSQDGSLMLTGHEDGVARLWDVRAGTQRLELKGHLGRVCGAAFVPGAGLVITGEGNGLLRVWSLSDGRQVGTMMALGAEIVAIEPAPDGKTLFCADGNGGSGTWRTDSYERCLLLRHERVGIKGVIGCAFVSNNGPVATAGDEAVVRVWDRATGEPRATWNVPRVVPDGVYALLGDSWKASEDRLAGACRSIAAEWPSTVITGHVSGALRIWDTDRNELVRTIWPMADAYSEVFRVELTARGDRIMAGYYDPGQVLCFDFKTGARLWKSPTDTGVIRSFAVSASGDWLATCDKDGGFKAWRSATPDGRLQYTKVWSKDLGRGPFAWPTLQLGFSPTGDRIAFPTAEGFRVYESATGAVLAASAGQRIDTVSARFSPDGQRVVTAATDSTVRIWNAANGDLLLTFRDHTRPVNDAAFSPDGTELMSCAMDGTAIVRTMRR